MRKIFDPTRTDDGCWRNKTSQEINGILKVQNIIGFIKKQRLNWLGHVERVAEDNIVRQIKRWKPMSKTRGEQCARLYRLNTTILSDIYKYLNYMFRPLWPSSGWIRYQMKNYILYFSIDKAHLMYNAHPKLFRHSF